MLLVIWAGAILIRVPTLSAAEDLVDTDIRYLSAIDVSLLSYSLQNLLEGDVRTRFRGRYDMNYGRTFPEILVVKPFFSIFRNSFYKGEIRIPAAAIRSIPVDRSRNIITGEFQVALQVNNLKSLGHISIEDLFARIYSKNREFPAYRLQWLNAVASSLPKYRIKYNMIHDEEYVLGVIRMFEGSRIVAFDLANGNPLRVLVDDANWQTPWERSLALRKLTSEKMQAIRQHEPFSYIQEFGQAFVDREQSPSRRAMVRQIWELHIARDALHFARAAKLEESYYGRMMLPKLARGASAHIHHHIFFHSDHLLTPSFLKAYGGEILESVRANEDGSFALGPVSQTERLAEDSEYIVHIDGDVFLKKLWERFDDRIPLSLTMSRFRSDLRYRLGEYFSGHDDYRPYLLDIDPTTLIDNDCLHTMLMWRR